MTGCEELQYYIYLLIALLIVAAYLYIQKRNEFIKFKKNESDLINEAYFDKLTKLPNKHNIDITINNQIIKCVRHQKSFFTSIIRIDNFHEVAQPALKEEVLVETGDRLFDSVRNEDVVGYISEDDCFAIVFNEYLEDKNLEIILQRINNAFEKEFIIDNKSQRIKILVGIAKFPQDATTAKEILKFAALNKM